MSNTDRYRPGQAERAAAKLAEAVLSNRAAEAQDLARKLLERQAAIARSRKDGAR